MQENSLQVSFDNLPQAVAYLINKVEKLESLLSSQQLENTDSDKWFNLQELQEYLPDRPARQTVYGWIGQRLIPYHKKGKKLQFLKSEIDAWLKTDKNKTVAELQAEAQQFVNSKKSGANESRIGTRSGLCRVQPTLHEVKGGIK